VASDITPYCTGRNQQMEFIYTWKDAAVYELSDLLSSFYRCFYLCHFEEDKMLIYTSKESRFISWLHTTRCNNDISSRMSHSSTL